MFAEYIAAALERAKYEIIDDPEPYYASVPGLPGVWATGKTFEECRRELISTIEGWIVLGLRMGHPIPSIDGHAIFVSLEPVAVVEYTIQWSFHRHRPRIYDKGGCARQTAKSAPWPGYRRISWSEF